jgi:hypothetical protein
VLLELFGKESCNKLKTKILLYVECLQIFICVIKDRLCILAKSVVLVDKVL